MKRTAVLHTMFTAFLFSHYFVITSSTDLDQNTSTISKSDTNTNISKEIKVLEDSYNNGNNVLEPSIDINEDIVRNDEHFKQSNVNSVENADESENILSNDTPVILTFSESSTIELEVVDSSSISVSPSENILPKNMSGQTRKIMEDIKTNISNSSDITTQNKSFPAEGQVPNANKNVTEEKNEEIPSFSEWAQKRLEEVEKNEQINSSLKGQTVNGKGTTAKLRWKNYASLDCGAKVIAANPESVSPGAILSPSSDEYKLNTCTSRIWFVVELCEAIQTKRIDLANYELFSSSPKDFIVSVSDRFPTRDWSVVGKFTAKDERDIQSFDLDTPIFGKYVKVEIKSHYGSEHYCPISLFRAYGTSVFEVLQKEDPGNINPTEDDDDDDDDDDENDHPSLNDENDETQKNLFSSATDAVISIVKRAAEVLGNKMNNHTVQDKNGVLNLTSISQCITPSHMIFCKNCSDMFFQQVYEIISCDSFHIKELIQTRVIYHAISDTRICNNMGYEIKSQVEFSNSISLVAEYITSFFSLKYIYAMCYEIAILENSGILNSTQQFANATEKIASDDIVNLNVQESHINKSHHSVELENLNRTHSDNVSNSNSTNNSASNKTDFEGNITYASQIKPTKTLSPGVQISRTDIHLNESVTSELELSPEKIAESLDSTENVIENNADNTTEIEGMDSLDDHLEHFIPEFNNDSNQIVPSSSISTSNTPQAQKESVFLRLSNRIKVLERNMSLSSQYLEELSRRYKKQVEEMQHLLEKTIVTLREETQKRDIRYKQLEERLDNLTVVMESLVAERHNWILSMYCLMTSILMLLSICFFCRKSSKTYNDPTRENKEAVEILRRKSIDVVTHSIPTKKKRRPSDQALKIVRCSAMINEDKHKSNNQRQRKRKKRNLIRSNSVSNIKDDSYIRSNINVNEEQNPDWIEKNHKLIEDIPFALEESDHTTLEGYPLENELHSTNDILLTSASKLNGSSSHSHESHKVSLDEISNNSEKSNLHNKLNDNTKESVKKERRSFKKLLKKVF